jgi:hypothetical protein
MRPWVQPGRGQHWLHLHGRMRDAAAAAAAAAASRCDAACGTVNRYLMQGYYMYTQNLQMACTRILSPRGSCGPCGPCGAPAPVWQDSPVCRQPSFRARHLSVLQPLPHPRVLALSQGVRVAGGTKLDCSLGGLGAVAVGCPKATKGSVVPASCPPPCAAGVSPWFAACAGCARHLHRGHSRPFVRAAAAPRLAWPPSAAAPPRAGRPTLPTRTPHCGACSAPSASSARPPRPSRPPPAEVTDACAGGGALGHALTASWTSAF